MDKKEVDRTSNKSGQVTIFIILGIVILFVVIFIMMLVSRIQTEQIDAAKEKIVSRIFQKEALRVYVEDCLDDALTEGILLLGKQGGIWREQGGFWDFSEQKGVLFGEERVFYGIIKGDVSEGYPCSSSGEAPDFCRYRYPDSSAFFGRTEFGLHALSRDLGRYITKETMKCMENFTKVNISEAAKLTWEGAEVTLNIEDGAITVSAHFPMKFSLEEQEFFQLSEFNFFYPTRLKQFLEVAVLQPLGWDTLYVDFNYSDETLSGVSFPFGTRLPEGSECETVEEHHICNFTTSSSAYNSFGIEFNNYSLDNGDTIFELKPTWGEEKLRDFQFRIARQNRPPVLDYISRCAGETDAGDEYDYLIVAGDADLGAINIVMKGRDSDEGRVGYELRKEGERFDPVEGAPNEFHFDAPNDFEAGNIYELNATVLDEHGLNDSQVVRVYVGTAADAVCCLADSSHPQGGSVAPAGTNCFASEEEGCFGESPYVLDIFTGDARPSDLGGYIVEERISQGTCDGVRADICGVDEGETETQLKDEVAKCSDGEGTCDKVAIKCVGADPWKYEFTTGGYWCDGPFGCGEEQRACETIIAAKVENFDFSSHNGPFTSTQFKCGCDSEGTTATGQIYCYDFGAGSYGYCSGDTCQPSPPPN